VLDSGLDSDSDLDSGCHQLQMFHPHQRFRFLRHPVLDSDLDLGCHQLLMFHPHQSFRFRLVFLVEIHLSLMSFP
jgi:hypothetical protein